MRIIHKLLLAFLFITLLMGAAGYIAVHHSERVLINTIGEESVGMAAALMYEVDEGIFDRIEFLKIYAQHDLASEAIRSNKVFDKYANPQDYINTIDRDWKAKLTTPPIKAVLNSHLSVHFADLIAAYEKEYGFRVYSEMELTNQYGVVIAAWPRTSDYLQADEQWYQQAKAEEEFWVGEIEYDESSDSIGADVVINLYDDAGNYVGIFKAVINIVDAIRSIRDYFKIKSHVNHASMVTKVITRTGQALYSSDNKKLMQPISQVILSDFEKNVSGDGYFIATNEKTGNKDELYARAYSKGFRDYNSKGWSIIIKHDKDEILKPVKDMHDQFIALMSLTIFLTGLLSFIVARSLSRPLEKLGEASIAIGKGQLDTRLDITSKDEMGSLSTLINEMVESLQRSTVSKSYLDRIVENMIDSLVVLSPQGVIEKVNRTTLDLLGYEEQELIGQPIVSIFAEEEEESFFLKRNGIVELIRMGSVRNIEKTYLAKNGTKISVLFSAAVMHHSDESVQGLVCIVKDISKRKQTEQELQKKSHDLGERVKELDCYFSLFQIIQIANLSEKDLFARTVNIMPSAWQYPDITCARISYDGNIYTSQDFKETSWRLATYINLYGEGRGEVEVFYMEECSESDEGPFLNEERVLLDHVALTLAETLMKMDTDKHLRESEEQNRLILESTSDGIYAVDLAGVCTICNRSAVQMLGYHSATEIIGKDTHSLFHYKYQDGVEYPQKDCSLLRNHEKDIVVDEYFWRADGNGFPVQCRPSPIIHDNEVIGSVISFTDMTEQRNTELQLRQAQKLESIGQLAAGIAHEINTPTQFVNDNTSFLGDAFKDYKELMAAYEHIRRSVPTGEVSENMLKAVDELAEEKDIEFLNEEIPQAIKQSQEGLERIGKIVRAMKEFSHPGVDEKTLIDINKAIKTTINVSRNEWKYHCDIETDLAPDLPLVPCLLGEINQMFLNLIVNASYAIADVVGKSGEMGEIRIATRQDDDWVEIVVSDTGSGIPKEIKERIFDPFFTTKEVGKGSGQGLSIAWSTIVDKHGGTIEVESEVGKGSTFIIRLPVKQLGHDGK